MKNTIILTAFLFLSAKSMANIDGAFLDAPYKDAVQIKIEKLDNKRFSKNDVLSVIDNMTPVRAQVSRGTCSIFSATAMLEGMLRIKFAKDETLDLSEEFLEFYAVGGRTSDGSSSGANFRVIYKRGLPSETTLPYIGVSWVDMPMLALAVKRCGHLSGDPKTACLLVHRDPALKRMNDRQILDQTLPTFDPELVAAKVEGREFRSEYLSKRSRTPNSRITTLANLRRVLNAGRPLTMGISFYYGAWNHRKADELGIGRSDANWKAGIVGYPEVGSVDRVKSKEAAAGHSILIVGYDENKVVETEVLMEDGTKKKFSYKGVYYFKNSWGITGFGKSINIKDEIKPGYGMITMKYAHEMGSFYQMSHSFFK
ncbi:hypothetical protein A9Q84_16080 [Halobacteriovorax marinus]|uniref:Peptidase C1A papain C-terminal domain-containing protein n=1 Tax=Halobacteriovorax marinus TaxID=97084 RepID=A0A1Y5F4G1_9BACT|nr:hypothetical protein A9Q84_16080 [Halobacteriovorax marinus]